MSRCSRLEEIVSRTEHAGSSRAELRGQSRSGATEPRRRPTGLVLQSSGRLTKLQSLQDKVSTFVAGVRSA